MTKTSIAWTDETWNPVTGCTKVSAGCKNCYAEAVANRWWKGRKFTDVQVHHDRLDAPLHWRKPRRVFVNSMSDLFHDQVPDDFIERIFAVMALCQENTFQVLTKRPARMRDFVRSRDATQCLLAADEGRARGVFAGEPRLSFHARARLASEIVARPSWPLPNVWLGVSCEDQKAANERVPLLLETPAEVRFLSCEPLLGPLNLEAWLHESHCIAPNDGPTCLCVPRGNQYAEDRIDWVIVGGESGPDHRSMDLEWARSLRSQCAIAGVPFFFKQSSGRWSGMGEDALGELVQEFPGGPG